MFTIEQREAVHDWLLELSTADPRIVAAAVVGTLARDDGDRWSDLDLTFAVADGVPVAEVLDEWTRRIGDELAAVRLFDLPAGATIYRVFLLPGSLQVDLSFTPASEFGPRGPKFKLLYGSAGDIPYASPPLPRDLFGLAVHHLVRARLCIERERWWQAEYWISGARDQGLALACLRLGLEGGQGRGFDRLPVEVLEPFEGTLVCGLDRDELLRALAVTVAALLGTAGDVRDMADELEGPLGGLAQAEL